MATKLEEKFVKDKIKGEDVFEFGCSPGKFTAEIAKDHTVTAIDLYDAEVTDGYSFIKGDILETDIDGTFDSVVCLSSFEHCGIESLNYLPGNEEDLLTLQPIADKLTSLIKVGGKLVITAPFGDTNIYYVDKDGNNGTIEEVTDPAWGFRTFRLEDLQDIFKDLHLETSKVYKYVEGDYFEESSWKQEDEKEYKLYSNEHRALICCVFARLGKV